MKAKGSKVACKWCKSKNTRRMGERGNRQRFRCLECGRSWSRKLRVKEVKENEQGDE